MKIIRNFNSLLVTTDFNDSQAILSDVLLLIFVLKLSKCILLQNATFQLKARIRVYHSRKGVIHLVRTQKRRIFRKLAFLTP